MPLDALCASAEHLPEVSLEAGDVVVREGGTSSSIWILVSGALRVVKGDVTVNTIDHPGAVIVGTTALAAAGTFASPIRAQAPAAAAIDQKLIDAAKKEGKVVWYTAVDLPVAEKVAKAFEAKYPGIAVRVERSGAERVFQRIGQEYSSNIHAVDVVNSSDAAHFIVWKRDGISRPYVPEDVAKHFPAEHKDPDGMFASFRFWGCVLGYNTNMVKQEEAPKSFADLLDPKWAGKMVKAHPGYSGTIMTATFQIARDLGWDYLEKLAKQRSCRCSPRPIHPRSSRSANAP